jgi:hypothetical protein
MIVLMSTEMEPVFTIDPVLVGVLNELVGREPIFHRP